MTDRPLSSHEPHDSLDRLHALLADRALFGLSEADARELDLLLQHHPEVDADALDLAAAALELAIVEPDAHPLPKHLLAQARTGFDRSRQSSRSRPEAAPAVNNVAPAPSRSPSNPALAVRERLGWLVAAACLLAALFGWATSRPVDAPTLAEQRERLLASKETLVRQEWTATEDPAARGATGDVVWSNDSQQGFMRFRGLAANDPKANQYQLWIFDAAQDERYPIDGGVFNVDPATGDVIVPIRAALHVVKPTLFAITVEKPGGVVVSSRARLPLLAKVL